MRTSVLYTLISLSGMVFGAEIVASHLTQSLVLLMSSYHMLYNILSLLLLVVSHRMSKGKTLKNTFGWARVKVLGVMINMLFLCALCFAVSVEAVQTIVHASHENTEPRYPLHLLGLGVLNLIVNILCFVLIGGYTHHQGCYLLIRGNEVEVNCRVPDEKISNMCSSRVPTDKLGSLEEAGILLQYIRPSGSVSVGHRILDMSRDISSCLSVIACGLILVLMDGLLLKYIDSILSFASVIVLLCTTFPFIRESGFILLQSIPRYIDVHGLTNKLLKEFPAVQNVHDFHVWRLTASQVIATAHVILSSPSVYISISDALDEFFKKEGISLVTIQPEFSNKTCQKVKSECILKCSSNNSCGALTCCGPLQDTENSGLRMRLASDKWLPTRSAECLGSISSIPSSRAADVEKQQNGLDCDLPLLPNYDFERFFKSAETEL